MYFWQEEIDRLRRMLSEIKPEDPALREQIARLEKIVEDLRQRLKQCQEELERSTTENQVSSALGQIKRKKGSQMHTSRPRTWLMVMVIPRIRTRAMLWCARSCDMLART